MAPLLHRRGNATFADIAHLPDDPAVEIIHGEIVQKAQPSPLHSRAQNRIGSSLGPEFDRKPGASRPGWWFGDEVDVEYQPHELFCHDLAGWRRERIPEG